MRDALARAVGGGPRPSVQAPGSCKWCYPTAKEHANYHCICSVPCEAWACPMSASGRGASDGCGIPVALAPVPVFRARNA